MNYNYDFGKSTCLVLSFKFWVLTLFLILIYSTILFSQNTVYIDPDNGGDPAEDGSIDHPFDSWADVGFQNNTTYLQKRGTTTLGGREIRGYQNITIGAYGSGENPVVTGIPGATTSIFTFAKAKNYVIEDMTLVGHHPNAPVAGVYVYGDWNPASTTTSENITIRNCDVSYCYNGLRFLPLYTDVDSVLIENCVIHDINEDGIFFDGVSETICRDLYIYRINTDWYYGPHTQANAPGDGIQYTGDSDNFLVERCIIDRRDTGLKFCLIHQDNVNGAFKNDGIIRDCFFYPPKDSTGAESAGGALYIFAGDSVTIERCVIYGRDRIYSTPGDGDVGGAAGEFGFDYMFVHHCLFDSVAIFRTNMHNDETHFNNNTYASNINGNPLILTGGYTYIKNSIFALGPNTTYNFGIGTVDSTLIYQGPISTWDTNLGFVDSENSNYHLTPNSIAVDKAIPLGYSFDLDSVPIPQGILPDIGACEYIDGSQTNNTTPQISNQSFSIDENSSVGSQVGTVLASDPDAGQTLTYSITNGNSNSAFNINPYSGVLIVNNPSALNYEVIQTFILTVMVVDNGATPLSASANISVNLNDVNEVPEIDDQSFVVDESIGNGELVGTIIASDPDQGQSLSFSIVGGNEDGAFTIDAVSGDLSVLDNTALNFNLNPTYSLDVEVQDDGAGILSDQAVISVSADNINVAPVIQDQDFDVPENSSNGQSVGVVLASDPNAGQTLTYSIIAGNTDNAFQIDASTGSLTVDNSSALNFELVQSFSLTVEVQDNGLGNLTSEATITIDIIDVNEVPEIEDQSFSIDENSPNGTITGTVAASDPDNGQTITFAITGGNTGNTFLINSTSGQITVSNPATLNYEINPVFSLAVSATDNGNGNLSAEATISINLNDVNEVPEIDDQSFVVDESIGNGELVGTVIASDPDQGQSLSFSLVGGNEDGAFTIDAVSGDLSILDNTALNFNLNPTYFLDVEVQDDGAGMLSDQAVISVSADNINVAPVIQDQDFDVPENSSNGQSVGVVLASDPNAGQTLTYSIIAGNTDNAFQIDASTGSLTVDNSSALNFELVQSFSLTVEVQDNGLGNLTSEATITIDILDVNEVPEILNQSFSIDENSASSVVVGTVLATDPDNNQTLTFEITSGNAGYAFQINPVSGEITVNNTGLLNYEVIPVFNLTVAATDNGEGNLSGQAEVTINVNDLNEAPEIDNQLFSIDENSSSGSLAGTIIAVDPDNGQSLSFEILSGNSNDAFTINNTNGELTVNNSSAINFEDIPVFVMIISVTDNGTGSLSDQAVLTVNINDLNEVPEIEDQMFIVNENSISGAQVGNIIASDPDEGQSLNFSIVSGNTSSAFSVNSLTGLLTINNSSVINFESNPVFNLVVQVDDNGTPGLSSQADITINLNDINEVPEVEDQSFSIVENSANGSLVGTVLATDPDAGQSLIYAIESGNIGGAFSISMSTGMITVNNPEMIDFENYPVYNLIVTVYDNGIGNLSDQATITIAIQNINEAPVIITETFDVTIDAALLIPDMTSNRIPVGIIQAYDPDENQILDFEITIGNHMGIWELKDFTGELDVVSPYVFSPLEMNAYSITIEVSDNGAQSLTTTAEIIVFVNILNMDDFIEDNPMTSFIDDPDVDLTISVFPNPAMEFVKIETDKVINEELLVRFYTLNGELVLRKEISPTFTKVSSRLDVSQLSNGIYVVNIIHGKVSKNVRLIKQ